MLKSALCSRQCWQGSFLPWSLSCMFGSCQLIACLSLASWTLCACKLSVWKLFVPVLTIMRVFFHLEIPCKRAKHFVFLFVKVEPFVLFFPRFLKLPCFLDWSCSRSCRCCVALLILLSSEGSIQWALNLFSFGHFSKLYFEVKYRCHQGFSLWKRPSFFTPGLSPLLPVRTTQARSKEGQPFSQAIKVWKHGKPSYWIPQCMSFQSRTQTITCQKNALCFLLDMFEVFVFGNSLFTLTLLVLFGKIEIKGIIYWDNFTRQEDQWQKRPLVMGNFYSFSTSGQLKVRALQSG